MRWVCNSRQERACLHKATPWRRDVRRHYGHNEARFESLVATITTCNDSPSHGGEGVGTQQHQRQHHDARHCSAVQSTIRFFWSSCRSTMLGIQPRKKSSLLYHVECTNVSLYEESQPVQNKGAMKQKPKHTSAKHTTVVKKKSHRTSNEHTCATAHPHVAPSKRGGCVHWGVSGSGIAMDRSD